MSLYHSTSNSADLPPGRVVGGYEVNPKFKYPWMVSLQNKGVHSCGGSLLNGNTVISAAHCIGGDDSDWTAAVHRHDLSKAASVENGKVYKVIKRIPHPLYNSQTVSNDAAIWKLDNPDHSPTGLLLDDGKYSNKDNTLLKVIGWGTTSSGGTVSNILLEVKVPVFNANNCKKTAYNGMNITSQFCAGYPEGGKDSCQDDSGGPIFIEENGSPLLVGIVSWGEGCALKGKPGVYTRTSVIRDFIKQNL
ncbi:trypsin-like serine protease [Neoconidiobolus thromboides FSU 785]|nr:trypsin-like serine protease [Neoconidiobolus thromboides FSU 785]